MNIESRFARTRSFLPVALLILMVGTASAHPGHAGDENSGIGWGLAHPFTGLDHLLAMVGVGLWAVQLGGRALWLLPVSFVAAMGLGGGIGLSGLVLPQLEPVILGSVLALGALIALAVRVPLLASMTIVGVSAFFHGQAHGVEMPTHANGWLTTFGVVVATAVLHGAGVGIGKGLQTFAAQRALQFCGATIFAVAALVAVRAL